MKKQYYFDHAATTPVDDRVVEAMLPYFHAAFANPSGSYTFAEDIQDAVNDARKQAAQFIHASESEIYFTSGGTESDNWALRGVMLANGQKGKHLVTSAIEHHAILNTCHFLEEHGYQVTYLPVRPNGFVSPSELKKAIRDDTVLVSIMFANNEIGTIEPIRELAMVAHAKGAFFHTDAVQAFGHLPIHVNELGIDLLSASAHKFYGPKGVGILYKRDSVSIDPLIFGGSQEKNLRAGTSHVTGIVGLGAAVRCCAADLSRRMHREIALRNHMIRRLTREIPNVKINGDLYRRLPNNISASFGGVEAESLLILLDACGISVSTGSACSAHSDAPSHVLKAIGLSDREARSTIRFTIGDDTTQEDTDYVVEQVKESVKKLRMYSPFYEKRG